MQAFTLQECFFSIRVLMIMTNSIAIEIIRGCSVNPKLKKDNYVLVAVSISSSVRDVKLSSRYYKKLGFVSAGGPSVSFIHAYSAGPEKAKKKIHTT